MHAPSVGSLLGLLHLARPIIGASNKGPALEWSPPTPHILPNKDAARHNAHRIFTTLHSAGRQWGSSTDHNGMSFFRATVPEGSYFFHGSQRPDRPTGFEWLAFEIEHSQFFATPWDPSRGPGRGPGRDPDGVDVEEWHDWRRAHSAHGAKPVLFLSDQDSQHPMSISEDGRRGSNVSRPTHGYLHTYRAARPLNLLYVDGMGAGKSKYGTLDTQDFILRGKTPGEFEGVPGGGVSGESDRAKELCEVADEWARQGGGRIDGIMRMEVGFEIIYCHFEEGGGLDLVSLDATALRNETGWVDPQVHAFEWVRAVGLRYDGFPKTRLNIDWSSIVSAYFYNINLTNPDTQRSEMPRVVNATNEERAAIKSKVQETMAVQRHNGNNIDWQGIVDLLVGRYSDRLAFLSKEDITVEDMRQEVNFLLYSYINFDDSDAKPSLERCRAKHLETALLKRPSWTQEDELLFTAVETVSEDICSTLIDMWEILGHKDASLAKPKQYLQGLKSRLNWSTWKKCGTCASVDEVCFVAMFPFGTVEDHYNPRCKNRTEIAGGWRDGGGERYWKM
ncbi:hypothetical protein MCOR21_001328 [Pyricularia oryzae]|nr:hypothetical protein MCOR23_000443 [Pyricularia oryzae]KAI6436043.1 hypothetical protein MCOR21_001328 [Pyricularia oryzae]KAI6611286.1 hypothetical protein MCOR08_010797 [Pyricularia oryzae]